MSRLLVRSESMVHLKVVDSFVPCWSGEVSLKLERVLRHLKGRREVWLAKDVNGERSFVAKCFLPGKKQSREYRREVDGLRQLSERGIICPNLLFTATGKSGELWVVTAFIENSTELSDLLVAPQNVSSSQAKQILRSFVQTLLKHWQAGVYQTDGHLRNFLWNGESIYTIDVGSVRFKKEPLSDSRRIDILSGMLGKYAESFRDGLIKSFIETCNEMSETSLSERMQSSKFDRLVAQEEARNLRRIWKKSQRNCSDFLKISVKPKTVICQRGLSPSLIDLLKAQPDELMEMGQRLKSGNTCTVQGIDWAGEKIVVKRYNPKSLFYRIRHYFHMSRAMRSWSNGIVMRQLGIPTILPLVVLEEHESGLLKRSYFLMEHFQGESLHDYLNKIELGGEDFDRVVSSLVQLFTRMKELRAVHGDLKAKNILVNAQGLRLIDTDGLRFLVRPLPFQRAWKSDFRRLLNNWPKESKVRQSVETRLSDVFEF